MGSYRSSTAIGELNEELAVEESGRENLHFIESPTPKPGAGQIPRSYQGRIAELSRISSLLKTNI